MRTSETRAFPARLAAFRRRFDHWRKNRTIGSRIPKRPWSAAAEQAEVHGIRRTWCRRASSDSEVLWNDRQDTKAEGPTDVMALVTLGLASGESVVCNVHGSGEKPEKTPWLSEYFKDRDVVVIGDNDTSSQRGARHWAQFIAGTAKGCRLAKLPGPVTQTGR